MCFILVGFALPLDSRDSGLVSPMSSFSWTLMKFGVTGSRESPALLIEWLLKFTKMLFDGNVQQGLVVGYRSSPNL